jgi:hypothetical protein
MRKQYFCFPMVLVLAPLVAQAQRKIMTVAGGVPTDVPALSASLGSPQGVFGESLEILSAIYIFPTGIGPSIRLILPAI